MRFHLSWKSYRPGLYEILPFVLIIVATIARLILIANNWPTTNSDEGNMGILARHVAYNGELPIFFYGRPYLGPLEGYIAAPLFHIFGPSLFTLRLALLPFYFFYMICMFYLVRMLYSQKLALFTIVLLSLGSNELFIRNLRAVGEYPETLLFASLMALLTSWLVLTSHTQAEQRRKPEWKRVLAYVFLGIIIGQALWVDLIVLPFVACVGLLFLVFCRHELLTRSTLGLLLGFILGAMPLIIHNITAPIEQNSIAVLLSLHSGHSGELAEKPFYVQWAMKFVGAVIISLPYGTGISPVCGLEDTIVFGTPKLSCMLIQGGWASGYLILWFVAAIGATIFILRSWKGHSFWKPSWNDEERHRVILQCCRLMLLCSAMLTLILYGISASAATYPFTSTRYLTGLIVVIPSVLWPLWKGLGYVWQSRDITQDSAFEQPGRIGIGKGLRLAFLILILGVWLFGAISTFQDIPRAQAFHNSEGAIINKLLEMDATRVYSEYWTCNRLTFRSEEKVICSSVDADLSPGFDRYAPYGEMVRADPNAVYLFPQGSEHEKAWRTHLLSQSDRQYREMQFEQYTFFIPEEKR